MFSGKRCLVISILLLISIGIQAQDTEYIQAIGKTSKEAKDALLEKILNADVQVAKHSVLIEKNGEQVYDSYTGVDSSVIIPRDGIELIHMKDFWIAMIEKSKVKYNGADWKVENITITNTYNEAPTYSQGFKRTTSTTRTTRRTDIIGPSGRVVKSSPGKTTTTTTKDNWNGRYGYTWSRSKTE